MVVVKAKRERRVEVKVEVGIGVRFNGSFSLLVQVGTADIIAGRLVQSSISWLLTPTAKIDPMGCLLSTTTTQGDLGWSLSDLLQLSRHKRGRKVVGIDVM